MPHPTASFALSLMQCQRRLQISRAKNIGKVLEKSGVTFRLAPSCGGLLVIFIIARICDCLYFGHGNSNKLVLCTDDTIVAKGLLADILAGASIYQDAIFLLISVSSVFVFRSNCPVAEGCGKVERENPNVVIVTVDQRCALSQFHLSKQFIGKIERAEKGWT